MKRTLALTALLLGLSVTSRFAVPSFKTWTGLRGGYRSTPDNWVPSGVPKFFDTLRA